MMLSEHTSKGDVEGFGIAILEANALGIPSIGAKGCGIEDAISNYHSGILVNHQDEQGILEAINTLIANYSEYSKHAIQWTENFSWDKIIRRYLEVLEKI